jgi:hypothetical protein
MSEARPKVAENEKTAGDIRMRVPFQFKDYWLGPPLQPDFSAYRAFATVIDFATHYVVVNSEGHGLWGRIRIQPDCVEVRSIEGEIR